jgi:hypothetical protein
MRKLNITMNNEIDISTVTKNGSILCFDYDSMWREFVDLQNRIPCNNLNCKSSKEHCYDHDYICTWCTLSSKICPCSYLDRQYISYSNILTEECSRPVPPTPCLVEVDKKNNKTIKQ